MATITEDYVSFEIAKLLREKGFTGNEIHKYYDVSDEKPILYSESYIHEFDKDFWIKDLIMVPTLQMAMKWLREVYNIAINIGWGEVFEDKFQWWCIILNQKDGSILRESEYYSTYEEACEISIKYCLENLI